MNDTIAAISTSISRSAIGIIRLSGRDSINILEKIFVPKNKKKIENFKLTYGKIVDNFKDNVLDEVLVSIMRSPQSYTKEDIVEINCHGGSLVLKNILNLLIRNGARVAEEGEFTKRAFLNGRIDLTQAESIIDLIDSNSQENLSISLRNIDGKLKRNILELKEGLINVLSSINVVVDYPEEVEDILHDNSILQIENLTQKVKLMIESYETGRKLKEGVKISIIGKPNVGKSTILNKLLKKNKAIVTPIPGTTRDIIEESLLIKGMPIIILDTAGIRKTEDLIEKIGIELSKDAIEKSDLILFVLDLSREIDDNDINIINLIKNKNLIYILNKKDLDKKINIANLNLESYITISTDDEKDIENLENLIYKKIYEENIIAVDELILNNIRHKNLLEKCFQHLNNFLQNIHFNPLDIASIDLKSAIDSLSEIIGEVTSEDILDNIFKNFCVGK